MKNLRKLAILLLDDENGINESAYNQLAADLAFAGHTDILNVVKCQDGRYFIGENDAERLMESDIPETQPRYARHIYEQQQAARAPIATPLGEQIDQPANCCELGQCLCDTAA